MTMTNNKKRNWLIFFRLLQGKTVKELADTCELSYLTYLNVENGKIKNNHATRCKTYALIAEKLNINMNLFFYETDESGRIIDDSCVEDVLRLFYEHNLRSLVRNEHYLRQIFSDEITDRLLCQLHKNF